MHSVSLKSLFIQYKRDFILLGFIIICAGLSFALFGAKRESGAYVRIEVNSEVVNVLPLNQDTELVLEEPAGEYAGKNIVVIQDGRVHVEEADCRDQICVHQGEKSQVGDTIICLPHRLVITVVGEEEYLRE